MDLRILQVVGEIAGIGGLGLGVLLIIFREIIRKNIFPTLSRPNAYGLLRLIAILTWSVAILGLIAWTYLSRVRQPVPSTEKPVITQFVQPTTARDSTQISAQLVRVSYFSIGGHALDFLIRGELDKKWEASLGGQPYIVPTASFTLLRTLVDQYKFEYYANYMTIDGDLAFDADAFAAADRHKGQPFFIGGTLHGGEYDSTGFHVDKHDSDYQEVLDGSSSWNLQLTDQPLLSPTPIEFAGKRLSSNPKALYFWRFARLSDLDSLYDETERRFYKYVVGTYLPEDFGIVTLKYIESCDSYYSLGFTIRRPRLLAVLVENVSQTAIRIGPFTSRQVSVDRLRSLAEEEEMMKSSSPGQQILFPQALLAPGEKLLVPLRLSMKYDDTTLPFIETLSGTLPSLPEELPDSIAIPVFDDGKNKEVLTMDRDNFLKYYRKDRPPINPSNEFIFGPSLQLDSVIVNEGVMPMRQFNPKSLVIRSGLAVGSCPYVFVYSTKAKKWVSMGHILFGINNKTKETTDTTVLKDFDGRILLRESEPETSFINSVQVDVKCGGAKVATLLPRNELLRSNDGRYLRLKQGDDVVIHFEGTAPRTCSATLRTTGYYEPY